MNIQEIERRLSILNEKKVPVINKRMLRGGMQERLKRQDIRRYKKEIENQKDKLKIKLKDRLNLLDTQKDSDFMIMSLGGKDDVFNEPKLKRIRNRRSFFR